MKKLIGFFSVAIITLTSCNNQEPKTETVESSQEQVNPQNEFAKLSEFMRKFEEPTQTFQTQSDKHIEVRCNQGTIIHLNPADLETENGQPIGKNIDIEVKELFNQEQLIRANIQTVSDGELLVSGGAVYINLTSDGQKLKLKEGKSYSVELPKLSDEEMTLYYGQPDSSNKMNWKQADQTFVLPRPTGDTSRSYEVVIVTGKDTSRVPMKNLSKGQLERLEKETQMANKVYAPIELNKFGWINCDRLFKPDAPRTNVQFTVTNKAEEVNYVNVYLVFKDIKSMMQSSYYIWNNKIDKDDFDNIPNGMTIKFFAVCYQNGKIFATLTNEMKVSDNQNEKLTLQEMSETDFNNLMKRI